MRFQFVEGLRALAAFWVMLGHAYLFAYGWIDRKDWYLLPLNIFQYLHFAVVVFLVISGFCLGSSAFFNKAQRQQSYANYLKARALRILPPYYAALILILLVNAFIPVIEWGRVPTGLTPTIESDVFWTNFLLLQDIFPQHNRINGPFWSIAVEWHIYFIFPLFLLLLRRWGWSVMLIGGLLLGTGLTWLNFHPEAWSNPYNLTLFKPPYFVILFVSGVLAAYFVAQYQNRPVPKPVLAAHIGIAAFFGLLLFVLITKYPIHDQTSAMQFFAQTHKSDLALGVITAQLLAVLALCPKLRLSRFLSLGVLKNIGAYSYSLYLIHIPIQAILYKKTLEMNLPGMTEDGVFFILTVPGSLLCMMFAYGFANCFETRNWQVVLKTTLLSVRSQRLAQ